MFKLEITSIDEFIEFINFINLNSSEEELAAKLKIDTDKLKQALKENEDGKSSTEVTS